MTKKAPQGRVAIFGAGSWGTALGVVAAYHAKEVILWGRDERIVSEINKNHLNSRYLKEIKLPKNLRATQDINEALEGADLIVNSIPTQAIQTFYEPLKKKIPVKTPIVNSAKGICTKTLLLPVEILQQALGRSTSDEIYVLSGPSFAKETAQKQATAVTISGKTQAKAEHIGQHFFTPWFRTYPSMDCIGVEIAGASKNVIAIASGIAEGLGLGFNTQSALITRGLAEITRLGHAYGADPLTFLGLAGVGDLVLTCTGFLSRNRTVGKLLAQGKSLEEAQRELGQVAEGVMTSKALHAIAQKRKIEMPIAGEIFEILFNKKVPATALADLMGRPMRPEKT